MELNSSCRRAPCRCRRKESGGRIPLSFRNAQTTPLSSPTAGVAQQVLKLQSTDEGLGNPQRRQRGCEHPGEILQVSGHVPSQCWVLVLLLKPRLENPLLLIIFGIIGNVRELIRVETVRGFAAYTEISCAAHKFTVLNSLHTAGHVHFCLGNPTRNTRTCLPNFKLSKT